LVDPQTSTRALILHPTFNDQGSIS
jgi:hypothetical protein